jgi:uncharacterized protein
MTVTNPPARISTPKSGPRWPKDLPPNFPEPIQVICPDLVLVDYGPMTLTISAWSGRMPRPVMAARAAAFALNLLKELAEAHPLLKTPSGKIKNLRECPPIVRKAVRSCRAISPELTGLAAVAGLVADEVLGEALRLGADRVIVNNGGDLALAASADQPVRVGLKTNPAGKITHLLEISVNDHIGGVATSGWTGRSFSTGVADIVTVWAGDGATADAAATWITARTDVNSDKVSRARAGDVDPETDIPKLKVTREVGRLTPKEKREALEAGLAEAERLVAEGIILGAFLAVQGEVIWISGPGGPEPRVLKQT